MNNYQLAALKKDYKGQRKFSAKAEGYSFDIFSDTWELEYKQTLYLHWMNELNTSITTFLDLRLAIAHSASHYPLKSLSGHVSTLKKIVKYFDIHEFNAWWLTLDSYKRKVRGALYVFCHRSDEYHSVTLSPLYSSIKEENLSRHSNIHGVLDIKTGAYSETEHDNILEALRIETLQVLSDPMLSKYTFPQLRTLIACQLMIALVRRPVQLVKIKWCDVLPVGQEFQSHKETDRNWQPITQHLFSDIEQLHLRTFKGKDGRFRFNVESRSHRLEPDFSQILLHYYKVYENSLSDHLNKSNVTLNGDEMAELMRRVFLLPDTSLFQSEFKSKSEVFMAISDTSNSYHMTSDSLKSGIDYFFKAKLNVKSDRLPNKPLVLLNNRWRHTQLTQAVWQGFSPAQVASITGVSIDAIRPYIDLKTPERVKIDQAYAGNQIIKRFDTTSVKNLQKDKVFYIKSQFDEEMGYKLNPANCSSCKSKGGAPMGCYPCDNFRPVESANQRISESSNHRIIESSNHRIIESSTIPK